MDDEKLDHRVNAFRPDLAESSLRPFVKADRYADAVMAHCVRGVLPVVDQPSWKAAQVSELRYGEFVDIVENREDGYAWIQSKVDRMVGYIDNRGTLSEEIGDLSTRVHVMQTLILEEPHPHARVRDRLPLGAYVRLFPHDAHFHELASGGYVFAPHVAATEESMVADYTFTAGRFLNVPFVMGGRTSFGVDSAGLVQCALDMAGVEIPRTVDQQRAFLGGSLTRHWRDIAWRRGDIVFFDEHVGIMTDDLHMISATELDMRVTLARLDEMVDVYGAVLAMAHPRLRQGGVEGT